MSDIEKIHGITPDLTRENVDRLLALFPDVATEITDPKTGRTERAVDFDALKERLGDVAEGNRERYQFTWPGKREAKRLAREPIAKTLRPVKERSKDWDTTRNLYIEGDNLDALKLLRENYAGKVKLIYIDPPYNTGHDFIYKDNFGKTVAADKSESGDYDDEDGQLVVNPESNGRFHSDWCSMLYPRLLLARDLLRNDGIFLINIGEDELDNTLKICDEIFSRTNRITIFTRAMKSGGAKGKFYNPSIDYIIAYAKNINEASYFRAPFTKEQIEAFYTQKENEGPRANELYGVERLFKASLDPRPNQRYYIQCPDGSLVIPPGKNFPSELKEGLTVLPTSEDKVWKWIYPRYRQELENNRIVFKKTGTSSLIDSNGDPSPWNIYNKLYLNEQQEKGVVPSNLITQYENRQSSNELKELDLPFDYAKPVNLLVYLEQITGVKNNDIVLDFFSGSASIAHATMQLNASREGNRKYILVQLPEKVDENDAAEKGYSNICEIGEERIRRAGEKIKSEIEAENAQLTLDGTPKKVPDIGFRVLRVDDSNYEDRRKLVDEYSQKDIDDDVDITKMDRSDLDLLFEALPKFQLPYSSKIDVLSGSEFDGHTVYSVNDGQLLACLEDSIPESLVRAMAAFRPRPSYVLVSENGFLNSAARTNFTEIFKQSADEKTGATQIRII